MDHNWHVYVSKVDEWMTNLEQQAEKKLEHPFAQGKYFFRELESLKKLRSKLFEANRGSSVDLAFTHQVERVERAYEQVVCILENSRNEQILSNQPVPIGGHRLPPLPYSYDALEPVIAEEIMRLHHLEHHQSYVDGLNKAEREMQNARETDNYDLIRHWEREAAFHGAGHYLHTMFWANMSPTGGGEPTGELSQQIIQDFGSYEMFKRHFSEAAKKVQGAGWALLVWSPRANRLEILQAEFHHLLSQQDAIPLLGLDVWEHAYYLQYKNNRGEYVDKFWSIIDWENVNDRFEQARKLQWESF
ncbi:superoxide dismutase [Salipaludibacillus keqinensis]|uniref:superoxide dismutase n=1 Tax=Salipaludibacillus keqinensis TaxID=2045207 RepID=A0A323TCQ6_9BACI|nr:superoxide dismutase [Salipaludibacillus keqinensis]PYZ91984.1 superoxide dismutase [Salipaludibacillus keqinensis]